MQKPKIQRPVQREKSAPQRERARCSENECTIQVGEEHLEIVAGSRPALHMLVPISFAAGAVVAFGLLLQCASEGVWACTRVLAPLSFSLPVYLCAHRHPRDLLWRCRASRVILVALFPARAVRQALQSW